MSAHYLAQRVFFSLVVSLLLCSSVFAEKKTTLIGKIGGSAPINDEIGTLDYLRSSYLFLNRKEVIHPRLDLAFIFVGLFNKFEPKFRVNDDLSIYLAYTSFLTIRGDNPRIDGEKFDDDDFQANQYQVSGGLRYKIPVDYLPYTVALEGAYSYWQMYDRSVTSEYLAPVNFSDYRVEASIQSSKARPVSELFFQGLRPSLSGSFTKRVDNEAWGPRADLNKVNQYFTGSASLQFAHTIKEPFLIHIESQASLLSKADRLNALGGGGFEAAGYFLEDIQNDRSFSANIGTRIYLMDKKQLATRIFGHVITYREVLPSGTRKDTAFGPGLKLMGHFYKARLFWDAYYALGLGHRSDLSALHEVGVSITYRFLP